MVRVGSDPVLSPSIECKPWNFRHSGSLNAAEIQQHLQEQNSLEKPPPKPSRIPSMRSNAKPEVTVRRQNSSKESDNENYPSNVSKQSSRSGQISSPMSASGPILPAKQLQINTAEARKSLLRHKRKDSTESLSMPTKIPITVPDGDSVSAVSLENYKTYLLPNSGENKPLEITALRHVISMLLDSGSRTLANHITQVDLRVLKMESSLDLGMGISSGLELLLLPQGHQLRQDILERFVGLLNLLVHFRLYI